VVSVTRAFGTIWFRTYRNWNEKVFYKCQSPEGLLQVGKIAFWQIVPQIPHRGQYVIPIDHDSISIREASQKDPGRSEPVHIPNHPSGPTTFVSAHFLTVTPISHLPTPTSREIFFWTCMITRTYHSLHLLTTMSQALRGTHLLHSTRSFNWFISLTLGQTNFGTAARPLNNMKAESVRLDFETWKLTLVPMA